MIERDELHCKSQTLRLFLQFPVLRIHLLFFFFRKKPRHYGGNLTTSLATISVVDGSYG